MDGRQANTKMDARRCINDQINNKGGDFYSDLLRLPVIYFDPLITENKQNGINLNQENQAQSKEPTNNKAE